MEEISGSVSNNPIVENNIECSSSSDETSFNNTRIVEDYNIQDELASWSVKYLISQNALNDLLVILKKIEPSLPKDARALKKYLDMHQLFRLQAVNMYTMD